MVSRYDAVLMAIPVAVAVGVGGDYLAGQLPAAVPLTTLFEQLPMTVLGLGVALMLIGHELTNPPVN